MEQRGFENIVGKGENTAFSPFSIMFSKALCFMIVNSRDCDEAKSEGEY